MSDRFVLEQLFSCALLRKMRYQQSAKQLVLAIHVLFKVGGSPMSQQVRGLVARAKGAPVTVEYINVPDPGSGEVVVKIQACGVCHTDLHYRDGGISDNYPLLERRRYCHFLMN